MKYTQPAGEPEDASYDDPNAGTGMQGDIVPGRAIEAPQREIVAVIEEAGLTPSELDNTQLLQAIQNLISELAATEPGRIGITARSTAPAGWLFTDGSNVSRTAYANLFAAIGTMFGAGDGSTTFTLPDTRGRTIIGAGTGIDPLTMLPLTARSLGATGGLESVLLSLLQIPAHEHEGNAHTHPMPHTHMTPAHAHTIPNHAHLTTSFRVAVSGGPSPVDLFGSPGAGTTGPTYSTASDGGGGGTSTDPGGTTSGSSAGSTSSGGTGSNTGSAGGGQAHTNMPPFIAFHVIIKT